MPQRAIPLAEGPREAVVWTLRGGLTPEDATEVWGFRWDEKTRRVLIPIKGGLLARSVHGEHPKYRMMTNAPDQLYWPGERPEGPAIAVEDILSAIAIYRAGGAAVAVLGTSLSAVQAAEIAAGRDMVVGWFDPDPAGDKAHKRLIRAMALHPVEVKRITSDKDPKNLHRAEIRAKLWSLNDRPQPTEDRQEP